MGRKKKPAAALNFDISIDVHGGVNLYKQGKGPTVQGVGNIDDRTLAAVMEELVKFENKERIKALDLSQNKIKKLPDKMQRLHKLEVLVLDCNQIESLPHWIGELESLKELWLQNNLLTPPLPRQLEECHQLWRLVVDRPLEKEAKQILQMTQNWREVEFEQAHGYPLAQKEEKEAEKKILEDAAAGELAVAACAKAVAHLALLAEQKPGLFPPEDLEAARTALASAEHELAESQEAVFQLTNPLPSAGADKRALKQRQNSSTHNSSTGGDRAGSAEGGGRGVSKACAVQ